MYPTRIKICFIHLEFSDHRVFKCYIGDTHNVTSKVWHLRRCFCNTTIRMSKHWEWSTTFLVCGTYSTKTKPNVGDGFAFIHHLTLQIILFTAKICNSLLNVICTFIFGAGMNNDDQYSVHWIVQSMMSFSVDKENDMVRKRALVTDQDTCSDLYDAHISQIASNYFSPLS